jgi:putative Mg2+ transporter-C (MgtC) family protein
LLEIFDYLRELNIASVVFRLLLSMVVGGMVGIERWRKRRPAGMRTYMIVCLGSTLTMLTGQYISHMLDFEWLEAAQQIGVRTDISRLSAQVINGIGFLGAGTILVTSHQEVKGLTTAACLWASGCIGLAIGAGFYECVLISVILVYICIHYMRSVEAFFVENARNMNIYVEFQSMADVKGIIDYLKSGNAHIYEIELEDGNAKAMKNPSGIFTVRLEQRTRHSSVLADISGLSNIRMVNEI